MVKVSVIKIFQPNIFLGTDIALFEKIVLACSQLRGGDSLLLPCGDVQPRAVVLYEIKNELRRVRVVSAINHNTFRCYLIDYGKFEEIGKHRMYHIPPNQLQMDPAVKLFKVKDLVPVGLNLSNEGASIKAKLSESNEWINASFKFVSRIFEDNSYIHVSYIKECCRDKAHVEVFVNYENKKENLKDILIRENYALEKEEDLHIDISTGLSLLDEDEKVIEDSNDSLAGESITKFLDDFKDDEEENISVKAKSIENSDASLPECFDSLTTNRSTFGTLDEISNQVLNNKVKSWLVSKTTGNNNCSASDIKYEYKTTVRPVLSYQKDQMISSFLKDAMLYHKTKSLLLIQTLMIPSILRGINIVAICPPRKGKSMGMLMPILQKIATKPLSRTRSFNPLAIILCASWKKVKEISDAAKAFIGFIIESNKIRKPKVVSVYAGQMEKKIMIPILEGCDILIITPKCLLRLLKTHEFFKLNELEIMGLDDAENLIAHSLDVLKEIFIYKQTGVIENGKEVHQIVTASNWTSGLQSFICNEMGNMFMLTVNNPLEIAVFERLKQKLIECDKSPMDLYQKLHTYLEMKESIIKRTIIFASDDNQIRSIYTFLMNKVTFDLKLMVGSMTGSELKTIEREWNQYRGYVNMPVLLISDEALGRSDISIFNAQTIFHADINPSMFGCRLNFLRDKFAELSFLHPVKENTQSSIFHSYIFMCVDNLPLSHANFLYKLLGRCYSDRPSWLQEKAIDYILNKERSKVVNEICHQIKSKGECQFPACTKRHIVLPEVDNALLPNRGKIKFRLLHLVSPSNFFIRILEHNLPNESKEFKSQFTGLKLSIIKYFADNRNVQGVNPKFVQPGFIAAIRFKDILERVQVIKMRPNTSTKIDVKLIDHGSTMVVEQSDLLTLPKELIDVPPQAVEIFLTGIRPLDNDEYYHEESCEFAQSFLLDKDLYGVIMLCIGKTLWIDSVTQLIHHKATNTSVYDKNLSVELIEKDFVEKNPGHIQRLIRLCTGKIDIWNSASQTESRKPVPIMRKFTYTNDPLRFEDLCIQGIDDYVENECTVLSVVSPNLIFLSNRDTRESIKQMQKEIKTLIDSVETLPLKDIKINNLVLFCHDSEWLRGYVLKKEEDHILLYSLDWGTIDTYTAEDYLLKKLPTEYQELPYHAVVASLSNCSQSHPFSEDAKTVIMNFVNFANNKKVLLFVSALSSDYMNTTSLFCDSYNSISNDLDIFQSLKRFSVSICKKTCKAEEDLLDVLVRKLCVIPSHSWIHTVLPESQPFISRLERGGSVPHMAFDIFMTKDLDKRLKISANMEKLITKKILFYENNEVVPSSVDSILNTLLVLLHFVCDQPVFMHYYRSLTALLNLAYKSKLPLNDLKAEEEFSISYISTIIYSYQNVVFHMLNHLDMTVRMNKREDEGTFLEMLKLLLVDSCFVNNLFEEESWVLVMATCVGSMQDNERKYNDLMDILVQLVMLSKNDTPFLAGVIKQCCKAVETSESPSVWSSSLAFISCLINCKVYYSLFRDLNFFTVLFDKMISYFNEVKCWSEMHETSLELLTSMWRNGSVDRVKVSRERVLSEAVRELIKRVPGNEGLARFLTNLLLEESSITDSKKEQQEVCEKSMPDLDASDWMTMKNSGLLKKHRKCYRKIFEDKTGSQESDNEKESVESDSDSSDVEVTSFFRNNNPADEDNVLCYDRP